VRRLTPCCCGRRLRLRPVGATYLDRRAGRPPSSRRSGARSPLFPPRFGSILVSFIITKMRLNCVYSILLRPPKKTKVGSKILSAGSCCGRRSRCRLALGKWWDQGRHCRHGGVRGGRRLPGNFPGCDGDRLTASQLVGDDLRTRSSGRREPDRLRLLVGAPRHPCCSRPYRTRGSGGKGESASTP